MISSLLGQNVDIKAAETVDVDIPFEELMTEDALIGYANANTWGTYFGSGVSIINDSGSGKIGWGGSTNAKSKCSVKVLCIVERYTGGSWVRVTSASDSRDNDYIAILSKLTLVGTGYYYRVRSTHYASTDVAHSQTDALRM